MKFFYFLISTIIYNNSIFAQKESRFSIEINYGLNGNFFVRSYEERAPATVVLFYNKKFIGSIGGLELEYDVGKNGSLGLAFAKSVNKREVDYNNGVNGAIQNFNISHTNLFYQLYYEKAVFKKLNNLRFQGGIFYLRMNQQEIDASPGGIFAEERDFENNKLEEGGVFAGVHYFKKIDTKFDIGIRTRLYYLVSTNTLEAITLTPTLTYRF